MERVVSTFCLISSAGGYALWVSQGRPGRCSCTLEQEVLTWNGDVEPLLVAVDQKQTGVAGRWVLVGNSGLEAETRILDLWIRVVVHSWIRGCGHLDQSPGRHA